MFSWHAIPFARILFPFILGITVYHHIPGLIEIVQVLLAANISLLFVYKYLFKLTKHLHSRLITGLVFTFTIFLLAYFIAYASEPIKIKNHYSKVDKAQAYKICVDGNIQEKESEYKFQAIVEEVYDSSGNLNFTSGKVIVKSPKNSHKNTPKTGDIFLVHGFLNTPVEALNPGDFNYKQYLKWKGIEHILHVKKGACNLISNKTSIYRYAEELRNNCIDVIKKHIKDYRSSAISEALLLGYKEDLDYETLQIFSSSGTMHILAVSGMHAGMVFLLLNFITGFLIKLPRGKIIQAVIILCALWFYVCMTGLSGSVVRAGLMFTFISVAKLINRKQNIFNTMYASAFFMLLYNPNYLFDAGFQLSYAAVCGIIFLYPKIRTYYEKIKNPYLYIIDVSCISVCAQIFTLPLSLYYFGQFPTYFILTNLIAIPIFSILLFILIGLMAFSSIPFVGIIIGFIVKNLINFNIWFMAIIDKLPNSNIESIEIDFIRSLLISIILLFLAFTIVYNLKKTLNAHLFLILLFTSLQSYNSLLHNFQKGIYRYNIKNHDIFICIEGKNAILISDSIYIQKNKGKKIIPRYLSKYGIKKIIVVSYSENLVTTNFRNIPDCGFQFFDRIMTMKNTVYLNIHPTVFYLYNENKLDSLNNSKMTRKNLIISNKTQYNFMNISIGEQRGSLLKSKIIYNERPIIEIQ